MEENWTKERRIISKFDSNVVAGHFDSCSYSCYRFLNSICFGPLFQEFGSGPIF